MNKKLLAGVLAILPGAMSAQSAIDAYSISQNDLRGTARFMAMGGAFTALGGDISTLNQNPGGIGVYRSCDLSATIDINMMSSKFRAGGMSVKNSHTNAACNNFGYVGSVNLGSNSIMPFFNWGASYSRVASFDRRYKGSLGSIGTSLTNLVADYTTADGYSPADLYSNNYDVYNPYLDSSAPWSSILMFDAYGINSVNPGSSKYSGLFDYDRSSATAAVDVEEKGHIDEYAINFGGNVSDVVYWGIGFGVTDIEYKSYANYSEDIQNANVPNADANSYVTGGNAYYNLANYKRIYGSGFNFKAGVIIKPINEFRIGLAVHTPTYYKLTYEGTASMAYNYQSTVYNDERGVSGTKYTDEGYLDIFDYKSQTPWRLTVGAAGVIDGRAIISADYEYRGVSDMVVQDFDGNDYRDINNDIKTYYKAQNIVRLGLEYRLTPQFSLRAGYSYESSPVSTEAMDGYSFTTPNNAEANYVYTSGADDTETLPSYTFDKSTRYLTCGLGYRNKNFYADAAFVNRQRKSKFSAFTDYNENSTGDLILAPTGNISSNNNSIVFTVGFRF